MIKTIKKKSQVGVKVPWAIVIPGLVCALIAHFIAPLYGAFYAFTNYKGIGSYDYIGFDNFIKIFQSRTERTALINTFKIAIPFLILSIVIGLILALTLKNRIKSRQTLRAIYFAPVIMIPLSVTQIWRYILDYDGPLNILLRNFGLESMTTNWLGNLDTAIWCILFVLVWQNVGYTMVIFNAGLECISPDLYEAASIDGATGWHKFRYVTLPLLASSFTICITLMSVTGLRVFDQVLGLTGGKPANMTHTLASDFYFQTWGQSKYGYGTALALVLTVLVSVIGILQVVMLKKKEDQIS